MKTIRVHISSLFQLATAEGIDRFFKTPRGKVGGFESATLAAMGASGDVAILPMRGDRWPDAALHRAQQIACETYKSMVRPNTSVEAPRAARSQLERDVGQDGG